MIKQVLKLTPNAVQQLLKIQKPNEYLKISTKKKGCVGLQYHMEFTSNKSKFDEIVKQDGVEVLVDSKALFSLIGSEMDYKKSEFGAEFIFNNPNIKEQCGCGQSFSV